MRYQGRIQTFGKGVALSVGNHGWPTKKTLGFRWSKKAKIMVETISFWQNISISIFNFFSFLYAMKACQRNLINFSRSANVFIRKEKKHLCSSQWEKKNCRKVGICCITGCFIKSFNLIINHFFVSQAYSQPNFYFLISGWRKKYQKGK